MLRDDISSRYICQVAGSALARESASPGDRALELARDAPSRVDPPRDGEADVVSRQSPEQLRVLRAVECAGNGRRRPQVAADHDQVLGRNRATRELAEDGREGFTGIPAPRAPRNGEARLAQRIANLLYPELPEIARDGRLRDLAAKAGERGLELVLRSDRAARDQGDDQPLPLGLRHILHSLSISIRPTFSERQRR